jgi:hypothetical protein
LKTSARKRVLYSFFKEKPMGSLRNDRRNRRLTWAIGVSLALAAGSVLADKPNADSTTQPGLMTFPNVMVVNAPAATAAPAKQSKDEGMRAYLDASRRLRPQTAEEGQQIAAETKAKLQAKTLNRSRVRGLLAVDEAAADDGVETFVSPDGLLGARLSEDFFVYQVAHKQDSGVVLQEATGKVAADKVVRKGAQKKTEVSNER